MRLGEEGCMGEEVRTSRVEEEEEKRRKRSGGGGGGGQVKAGKMYVTKSRILLFVPHEIH